MKIVIYSGYNNGLGDLNFGIKLAMSARSLYPDAEIELVTTPTDLLRQKSSLSGLDDVRRFNASSEFQFIPFDKYVTEGHTPPDMLIVGPTLNFAVDRIQLLVSDVKAPIMLMTEYDFPKENMEDLSEQLADAGYVNVIQMPTGLCSGNRGIFIDQSMVEFNRLNRTELNTLFSEKLPLTAKNLLGEKLPADYMDSTDISVNYSHNNAERFLTVHSHLVTAERDADVIMMGEVNLNDKKVLNDLAPTLIAKGFGKVVYHEVGKDPEILACAAEGEANTPTYRILHTGRVSSEEAGNLRKIGGDFCGATGDQSYSEAISCSSAVVYECFGWKGGFLDNMVATARKIDDTGELERTIRLMGSAENLTQYKELSELLKDPDVQQNLARYRETILNDKNLTNIFDARLQVMGQIVQQNKADAASRATKFYRGASSQLRRVFQTTSKMPIEEKTLPGTDDSHKPTGI